MNHLGVALGDAFGLFWVFGWISGKMDEINKSGEFWGLTPRRRDPTQQCKSMPRSGISTPWCCREGGFDKPQIRQGVAKLHRGEGLIRSLAVLCRGVALFTDMCIYHVFLFRYSEDLSIGLMRTL